VSIGSWLRDGLSSQNGFVRKGARGALFVPKWLRSWSASPADFAARPPVLANSFPKSGTHLLLQLVNGLPDREDYGAFLGSETSSFQLRERSEANTSHFIQGFVPGEVIRGHLYHEPPYAAGLAERNTVHYFIYRDLRAVVVSEAHYLREMNRWHKLAPHFSKLSIEDAIALSITGFDPPVPGINYPNIAERFARYRGWLTDPNCMCIRFEDLRGEQQDSIVREMAKFYLARCSRTDLNVDDCVRAMKAKVAPEKSHTFRSGKKSGWQAEFTDRHRRLFDEIAGDLTVALGYERDAGCGMQDAGCRN
jgi:sulfotransferase 6B1